MCCPDILFARQKMNGAFLEYLVHPRLTDHTLRISRGLGVLSNLTL